MTTIKIYPPKQLPSEGVSEPAFNIWREELEVYLEIDNRFQKFLPGGDYQTWEAAESFPNRIRAVKPEDLPENLNTYRKELRQFLTIIAKLIHTDYYNPIIRHSTSLDWIYIRLRQDFNIQYQGVHFLNILDMKWDPTSNTTPIGLYNNYRSMIMGNMGKVGDNVLWQNKILTEDEKLTPSHEDLIFLNVLTILHPKLPAYIKENYAHRMDQTKRLMDFKTEILTKAKQYIEEIEENTHQLSNISLECQDEEDTDPSCNYVQQNNRFRPNRQRYSRPPNQQRFQPQQRPNQQRSDLTPFCRLCQLSSQPRSIFTSHYIGDENCPSMSQKDKQRLKPSSQLNNIQAPEPDIASEYGYEPIPALYTNNQVDIQPNDIINTSDDQTNSNFFSDQHNCNYIKPVPTQTLTTQDSTGKNVHLDLDTGATVSYAKFDTVKKHNFPLKPNSQLSNLADGQTKMPAVGEIDIILYRNNWKVRFHAIVTQNLHCDFVAGNNFFKENEVTQDINNKTITINGKYTVPETNKMLILPTSSNMILKNNSVNVVLPGQEVQYKVPHQDQEVLAVQPCFQNKQEIWPEPQICKVSNGFISVVNKGKDIIAIKNGNSKIQARTLHDSCVQEAKCFSTSIANFSTADENFKKVQINTVGIDKDVVDYIKEINEKYRDVFNEDLSIGYNGHFGTHKCRLNWANDSRPPASKVHNINYDHDSKVLLQQVCDEFTNSGVLGIPQENNVQIQHVSPAFLVRKQRAKNKAKNELTTKDVRLVVNFSKVNEYLINIPTPVTKPKDIFTHLGRWKFVIVMDLFQGFFQNQMHHQDGKWLGISTPFGGLRYMKRSGQGLLGQSEELDEMLSKVLSLEMQSGHVARIADDLYIGGSTPRETADNYDKVLSKLQSANLKVSSEKTKVFLESVDILGWVWKKGGFLSPSPHRISSLKNTTPDDIKCVKDMRSYIGLYKTLMPATPNLTLLLDPFDKVVADKQSKEPVEWDETLKMAFIKAKEAVDSIKTLYLPEPNDQLLLVVDAAKAKPGLGHILYAIKDNKKLPVSFHSNKLSESHAKWHSCELEALAFATAITSEYHILKESRKPVIIAPDSKAVADAANLIKNGKHSSNPRIQALITNVNRIPLIVQLANGKNKLNQCGDHQSRYPSACQTEHCTICNFVNEVSHSTLHPYAINAATPEDVHKILDNKQAWKTVQENSKSCQQAKFLISSGKTPSKQSGKHYSEIRRLASVATLNREDMLIVNSRPNVYSSVTHEQIVIPSTHLPAVLWQLHNSMNHPSKSQLKLQFERTFYSVGLHPELDKLYINCHFCASQMKIPSVVQHHSKCEAKVPGTNFHADVIKRKSQNILIIRDNFSSYTVAKIIKSETHRDLKEGIVDLIIPIKLAGKVTVKVDNATGFKPLLDQKDADLNKLDIDIICTDVLNKNENAVVDRACFELEQELIRIEPDGRQVNNTTIQHAVQILNQKLRRNGKLSAFEIHFNRDSYNGRNLNLNYDSLKDQQLSNRNMHNERHNKGLPNQSINNPLPGDIVVTTNPKSDKHRAKDLFLVTDSNNDKVNIQKLIHPFSQSPSLRSKQYVTEKTRIQVTRSCNRVVHKPSPKHQPEWNPVNLHVDDSSDDDYAVPPVTVEVIQQPNTTLIAPPPTPLASAPDSPLSPDSQVFVTPARLLSRPTVTPPPSRPSITLSPSPTAPVYQQLNSWLQDQRHQAHEQLLEVNTSEKVIHQPTVPPVITVTPPATQNMDKRAQQKEKAKQKIASCFTKQIPQVDGYCTESSAPSTEPSPETSPEPVHFHRNISPPPRPISPIPDNLTWDYEWDYDDYAELQHFSVDANDVFDDPYADVSFLPRSGSSHL